MSKEIELIQTEEIRVVYLKYKGDVTKAKKMFPTVFKSIRGKNNGAPFFLYNSIDEVTNIGDLELCVPTEEAPTIKGVEVKTLPRVKALRITHEGPYEYLTESYKKIEMYAEKKGYQLIAPYREVYIKGPGMIFKGNRKKYITELIWPVKGE